MSLEQILQGKEKEGKCFVLIAVDITQINYVLMNIAVFFLRNLPLFSPSFVYILVFFAVLIDK